MWGLSFLVSFLTLEILLALGRKERTPTRPPRFVRVSGYDDLDEDLPWNEILGASALIASLLFSFSFFALAVSQIVEQNVGEVRWPYFLGFAILGLIDILSVSSSSRVALISIAAIVTIPFVISGTMSTTLILPMTFTISVLSINGTRPTLIAIAVAFTLCCTVVTTHRLVQQSRPVYAKYIDFGLGTFFVLLNLSAALLYYSMKYDPKGTTKPSWTDQLG